MHPPPGWVPYRPAFPSYPPPPPRTPLANTLLAVASVFVGGWIVLATTLTQAGAWLFAEVTLETGGSPDGRLWPVAAALNGCFVVVPAGLLWILGRTLAPTATGVVAAGRAWTLAGVAGALLGTLRLTPIIQNEWLLLGMALLAALLGIGVRLLRRTRRGRMRVGAEARLARRPVAGFAVAAGLVALLPWLWAGALGGLGETLLAVVAAAAVGWLAAGLLDRGFFAAYARSRAWQVLVGGLAAGVSLAALASGVGGFGVGLAELVALPALGFALAALATSLAGHPPAGPARPDTPGGGPDRGLGLATGSLVALGAVGPLAFVDPEETSLILGLHDVGRWTFLATLLSAGAALVTGGVLALALSPLRWLRGWIPAATALVVALGAVAVYAGAGQPGLHGDRLFVILADQADLSGLDAIGDRPARLRATYQRLVEHAQRTQAPLRASLARWGLDSTPYYLVNAVLVDGGPAVREWLASRSDVDRVLIDQRLRPLPSPPPTEHGSAPKPSATPQWNVELVGAPQVWSEYGARGAGIVIGTSDSGVDGSHPALRAGFRGGDDSWYDPWNGSPVPVDHGGHGTHTLGSALGRDGIGVAPDAQWVGCVNLDRNLGSPSRYLDCLQFMLAPFPPGGDPLRDGRPERAPHVLTNSWGCPELEGCDLDSLRPAIDAIRSAGIFMAVAAGNSGPACSTVADPPAPYDGAFTVGAVDRAGAVAPFSSRGPTPTGLVKPDILAPGVDVLSSLPDGTYGALDGTSMATPHVAGVVALLWSANPDLIGDIETTQRLLRSTAIAASVNNDPGPAALPGTVVEPCGPPENTTGAGIVNALAALRASRPAD